MNNRIYDDNSIFKSQIFNALDSIQYKSIKEEVWIDKTGYTELNHAEQIEEEMKTKENQIWSKTNEGNECIDTFWLKKKKKKVVVNPEIVSDSVVCWHKVKPKQIIHHFMLTFVIHFDVIWNKQTKKHKKWFIFKDWTQRNNIMTCSCSMFFNLPYANHFKRSQKNG